MIIDTSVIVKWFYEEAETPIALRLFDQIINNKIHAIVPKLVFYEFANVLKFKGGADGVDVEEALTILYALPWNVIDPYHHHVAHAIEIAEQYKISVYDATYVALALEWNDTVITADSKLVRAVGEPKTKLLCNY